MFVTNLAFFPEDGNISSRISMPYSCDRIRGIKDFDKKLLIFDIFFLLFGFYPLSLLPEQKI